MSDISEVVNDRATAINLLRAAVAMERGYCPRQRRRRTPKKITPPVKATVEKPQAKRTAKCGCGHCRSCIENARWDRVYYEKFADLSYYSEVRVWNRSPLAGL
ncbi:MAG: hypothetical protein U0Q18_05870 [Bryobacteraceae bacterium]